VADDFHFFAEGAKRVSAGLAGAPGPVPVTAQTHEFAARRAGVPSRTYYTRPDVMVPALLEAQAAIGVDGASLTYDVYNIEAEALGQAIWWTEDGSPDIDRVQPMIQEHKDLSRIRTPDFEHEGRFPVVIDVMRRCEQLTGTTPALRCCAPFTMAANLRGIESLLMDLYEDPPFARELLDRVVEDVLAPWIRYQRECLPSATAAIGSDAVASLPIVNLKILREWIVPGVERLRTLCGMQVAVPNWVGEHYLKQPAEMLDLKRKVSVGSLLGQDPDAEILGPGFYREYAEEHQVPLTLGIGAAFLAQATPDEVEERVSRYIHEGRPSTGFAIYLCNIGASTPLENARSAVRAAHRA